MPNVECDCRMWITEAGETREGCCEGLKPAERGGDTADVEAASPGPSVTKVPRLSSARSVPSSSSGLMARSIVPSATRYSAARSFRLGSMVPAAHSPV